MNCPISHCRNYFLRKKKIWCISEDYNIIFTIDIHTCDVEYVCHISYENIKFKYLFLYNDMVYCVPDKGQQTVAEYDIKNRQIKYYNSDVMMEYQSIVLCYNDNIYFFFDNFFADLPCFNVIKKEFHYLKIDKKEKIKLSKTRKYDNYIIGIDEKNNRIISYDTVTGNCDKTWQSSDGKLSMATKINNKVYACMSNVDKVVCIDEKTQDIKEFNGKIKKDKGYHSIIPIDDKIFLTKHHLLYYLDENKQCIEKVRGLPASFDVISKNGNTLFSNCCAIEGGYLLIPWNANMFLKYEKSSNKWYGLEISINPDVAIWYNLRHIVYEGNIDVDKYLQYVILNDSKNDLTYDKEIWGLKAIWKQ